MNGSRQIMNFAFSAEKVQNTHFHQELELIYLLEGKYRISAGEENYLLKKGDFMLINTNKKHRGIAEADDVFLARFQIDYQLLAERLGTKRLLFWCNTAADKNEAYEDLRTVLDRILDCYYEQEDEGALYLESLYFEALYILTGHFMVKTEEGKGSRSGQQESDRIYEIQNYIQSNYQSQITLNDLAAKLYLSNAYLSKYIKKQLGLSFVEYLSNVRLFHAMDDLLYTDKKIVNIAIDNGFPTTSSFNKTFRETYHMTPSVYRAKKKQEHDGEGKDKTDSEVSEQMQQRIKWYLKERHNEEETAADSKLMTVDAASYTEMKRPWGNVINISNLELLLSSDVRTQVLEMKKELGFSYVRIWNVFVPSMYNEKGGQWTSYNFGRLDRVLDFLIENDIRPFFELAFKPMQLIYSADSILVQNENEIIFTSLGSYNEALKSLADHLVKRYGTSEVERWYFELWHDPRMHIEDEEGWFYDNFDAGYLVFKAISEKIKVGGGGFALGYENAIMKRALKNWSKREVQPDFISVYAYNYITKEQDGKLFVKKSLDSRFIRNQMDILTEAMKDADIQVPEIYVTEWNFTISNRNRLNDSCAHGADIMKSCIDAEGEIDLLAYWHGTDLYSEYYDAEGILCGDSGLISRDGIRKPAFYAFYFMRMLENRMLGKNESAIITGNDRHGYKIACHNCKKLTHRYAVKAENEIMVEEQNSLFEDCLAVELKFKIKHVKNGDYRVKISYINSSNGSVQEMWREMEHSKNLTKSEIEYFRRNAMPHVEMKMIHVDNGILQLENTLMAHEIRLIDIQYQN